MSRVVIYTKTGCPSCEHAKAWLDDNLIDWNAVVWDDFGGRQAMYASLGLIGDARRVPQILVVVSVDGKDEVIEHIRGYESLIASGLENRIGNAFSD